MSRQENTEKRWQVAMNQLALYLNKGPKPMVRHEFTKAHGIDGNFFTVLELAGWVTLGEHKMVTWNGGWPTLEDARKVLEVGRQWREAKKAGKANDDAQLPTQDDTTAQAELGLDSHSMKLSDIKFLLGEILNQLARIETLVENQRPTDQSECGKDVPMQAVTGGAQC